MATAALQGLGALQVLAPVLGWVLVVRERLIGVLVALSSHDAPCMGQARTLSEEQVGHSSYSP